MTGTCLACASLELIQKNVRTVPPWHLFTPTVHGCDAVTYISASDEHGVIENQRGVPGINEKLKLIRGHRHPICNLHDW